MGSIDNPNLALLELAVDSLDALVDEFVFLGGCATGLLMNDAAAPPIRETIDVDVIVHVLSKSEYYALAERLRERGFSEDSSDDAPQDLRAALSESFQKFLGDARFVDAVYGAHANR